MECVRKNNDNDVLGCNENFDVLRFYLSLSILIYIIGVPLSDFVDVGCF